ncbi:hypothetical protein [Flavobacterium rhizosphaerae]|uniref:Uncharacterized protein n=1 Tax=Flavobacterium rhizosphaerae TaxID=3163298 RepID=A0ABW8YTY4_9FLAO
MKKSIFTSIALLALTIASAQSYPKQPDPKTYVVKDNYSKAATEATNTKVQQATTEENDTEIKDTPSANKAATSPNTGVAVNSRKETAEN